MQGDSDEDDWKSVEPPPSGNDDGGPASPPSKKAKLEPANAPAKPAASATSVASGPVNKVNAETSTTEETPPGTEKFGSAKEEEEEEVEEEEEEDDAFPANNLAARLFLPAGKAKKGRDLEESSDEGEDEEGEEVVEEIVDTNDNHCGFCRQASSTQRGDLVCCDFCPGVYHAGCLGVRKPEDIPEPYSCPVCVGGAALPALRAAVWFRAFFRSHIVKKLVALDQSLDAVRDETDTDRLMDRGSELAVLERCGGALQKLQQLDLEAIGDNGAVALAEALGKMVNLTVLGLGGNGIGAEGAVALAEALGTMANLTELDVSKNEIGSKGADALAGVLGKMVNLTVLDLEGNDVGELGARRLALALGRMTTLSELDLDQNNIGAVGAWALAGALGKLVNLTVLDLARNLIGVEGARRLAEPLGKMVNLRVLRLSGNNIRSEEAGALEGALGKMVNMTELDLARNRIKLGGAVALAGSMGKMDNLAVLDLGENGIGDEGVGALEGVLGKMVNLTVLDLAGNVIGAEGARRLAEPLGKMVNLRVLRLSGNDIRSEGAGALEGALGKMVNMTELDLARNRIELGGAVALAGSMGKMDNLAVLDLGENGIGDEGVGALEGVLGKMVNLTVIDLAGNVIGAEGARRLAEPLGKMVNLRVLRLSGNDIRKEGAGSLAVALGKMDCMKELNLTGNRIGRTGSLALAGALGKMVNMTVLDLHRNELGAAGAVALAGMLDTMNSMTTLRLGANMINAGGARALSGALGKMVKMTELDLSDNEMGEEGAKALAVALGKMVNMTSLRLGGNAIGKEGAVALAEALDRMVNLTVLGLGGNGIGAEGAVALAEALGTMANLTELDVSKNDIGSKGADALAEVLGKMVNLTVLDLEGNDVGELGARRLKLSLGKMTTVSDRDLDQSTLAAVGAWSWALAGALGKLVNLTVLDLAQNLIGAEGARRLAEPLGKMVNLRVLRLSGNDIRSEGAGALEGALGKMVNMTELDLARNRIKLGGAVALAGSMGKMDNLAVLDLGENGIGDEGVGALEGVLGKMVNLTVIDLAGNVIGAEGARRLAEPLGKMVNLRVLRLSGNYIRKEGAGSLAVALGKMDCMKELNLTGNRIGRTGSLALAGALGKMVNMTVLDLHRNELGAAGAVGLAGMLDTMDSMTTLRLGANMINAGGARALSGALGKMVKMTELDLSDNEMGEEGAKALAVALGKMVNMTSLRLGGNAIGKEGAVALLPSLLRMVKLSTFELDFGPSKVWASASSEYRKPPSEVLEEGWNDTLRFLRELQGPAGSTKCWHARLMLVGLGMVGKTSVWQALQSKTGLTEGIDKDQRTVGVDVDLSWRPLSHTRPETQGRDLELHVWDLGGQTIYQSVHSLFLTRRCIYLLAFRADESDGNGAPRSAEKVFESGVEPWLRLIHSRVPDAHVLLVCTRWCTPAEAGGDIAAHQERVRVVADEVVGLAEDLVGTLNEITAREVEVLVRRLDLVRVRLEEAENELRGIGDERSSAEGGHGQKRRKEVECQRSEMAEIEARLGTLRRADGPEEMSLVGGKVHCIECVEGGDGSTVLKLREDLIECATSLPFMGEEIPARWDGLKKKLEREWPVVVQRSSEAVRALISECAPMTEEQVWEGLRFWELLGFVIVHGDVLVPRPRVLIDFLRPLVHHAPVDALLTSKEMRLLARAGQGKATKLRSEDWVVPPDVSAKATKKEVQQVQELVRDLQDRWVLKKKLLPYLAKWHEMREEERGDLLGVLEKFHLVVKYGESEESWLCACRLVAAEGSDATTPDWSRYENHATVRYTFDFLPRPLFPRFLAMQILNPDFKTERLPDVASNMLSMRLKKLHQKDGTRSFLVELEREDEKDNGVLRVASTNLVDLRMLCCALEGLIGKGFVALAYSTQVEFRSERPGEEGRFKWEIDQKESLASLLRGGRRWEEEVQVENVEDRRMTPYFRLGDVFGAKSPAFFFSHCWGDEREPMLDHLACRIEDLTGERVFDTNELAKAQDFGGRMEDGVRRAQCVFVFLSREYLAKRNCLLELKLAREQHLENGTRVVLIAMEPAVSFEEIQRWTDGSGVAVPGGGLRVHRHTVAWVKEHLLNSKINMEWSVHEGFDVDVGARDKTLDTILRPQSRERAATSWAKHDFELCPSGDGHGGHFLRDKALPEPEVADRKHGLLGPDEEHAGRGGEKKARVEAETGGGASQGKQVVVGFFPEERWDNPKKAIHPLGEAQELSFLYKSSVWDFQLHPRPTVDSFCERMWALLDNSRVIVHFAGHCSREGALHWLKDREGRESEALDASVFVDVMKEAVKRGAVVCVVLNACLSLSLGEKLCTVAKVPHVVCWKGTVDDSLAAQSAKTFWQSLDKDYRVRHCGEGDSREEATDRLACRIETAIKKCKIQLMEVKKRAFKEGGVKAVPRERLCLLNSEGGDLLPGDSEDEKGFGRRRLVAFFPEKRLENISPLGEDLCSFLYASDVWDFEPHAWPTADLFCDTMVAVAGQGGIVHFAGHCDEEGTLCWVRDREGQENEPLAASTMVTVMKKAVKSGAVVCVVLNACESLSLGERLRKDAEVPHVVCWRGEVGATRAAKFALTFYKSLESSPEEYFVSRREKGDSKEKAADRLARRIKAAVVACKGTLLLAKEEAALVGAVPRERLCLLSTGGDLLPGGSEDGYGWSSRDGDTEGGGEEEGDEEGEAEGDEESEEEGDEEGEEEGDEEGEEQEE